MTDTFSKAAAGYERIREVLDTDNQIKDLKGARRAPRFKGAIEFDHVSFAYQPGTPVLKDVSLAIKPGQVAALVGPTGAGKSTIISLIPRFYEPDSGVVKIDDVDVRRFTQKSLRSQISFVLQDTVLFHAPIWQNIAYGKPEASRRELLRAAELANAHEFIEKLPEGYDTMVGERGVTLSGGQRQRIAIARAIIRDTPILIMDEPSSGLDAESEKMVFEALGSADGGSNEHCDCPPALDDPQGRRHLRCRGGNHRRDAESTRISSSWAGSMPDSTKSNSPRARKLRNPAWRFCGVRWPPALGSVMFSVLVLRSQSSARPQLTQPLRLTTDDYDCF